MNFKTNKVSDDPMSSEFGFTDAINSQVNID